MRGPIALVFYRKGTAMKNKTFLQITLLLLCVVLVLPLVGCQTTPDPVETDPVTDPVDTEPSDTNPTDTEPADTEPADTEPDETEPAETEPEDEDTMWNYVHEKTGVLTREITIDSGKGGDPVEIVQITDIHFNYCNEQDLTEKNPALMSTYEHRQWLKNGASLPNAQRCLNSAKDADMIVLTGDTLDYLSYGCIELMEQAFLEPYEDKILAAPGNHEATRKVEGLVDDNTTLESRLDILGAAWPHELRYASVVLEEKVMLIQLDNSTSCDVPGGGTCFYQEQVTPLREDLALARENGYVVLLFYHIPLGTGTAQDYRSVSPYNEEQSNFYSNGIGRYSTGASKEVYTLITNNADIIKGAFCGHVHNDYYTNIKGTGQNGTGHLIPQYIMRASAYESGHIFRIIVE